MSIKWLGNPGGQDYQTPKEEFERLHKIFNFTVDCCASEDNHLLPRYWSEEDSCLNYSWRGERLFCNPPFTKLPSKILEKCREADMALVVLMLNQLTTRYVHDHSPDYIIIPDQRIKFYKEGAPKRRSPTFGVCYLLYGKYCPPIKNYIVLSQQKV